MKHLEDSMWANMYNHQPLAFELEAYLVLNSELHSLEKCSESSLVLAMAYYYWEQNLVLMKLALQRAEELDSK